MEVIAAAKIGICQMQFSALGSCSPAPAGFSEYSATASVRVFVQRDNSAKVNLAGVSILAKCCIDSPVYAVGLDSARATAKYLHADVASWPRLVAVEIG